MTDLVERARKQAFRVVSDRASMKAGYGVSVSPEDQDEVEALLDQCADEIERLTARVAELEEALKPFAEMDLGVDENPSDDWFRHDGHYLKVGNFQDARALLDKEEGG